MAKGNPEGLEAQEQDEEVREAILAQAPQGQNTATGVESSRLRGEEDERMESLESRGSQNPIAGGDSIKPDLIGEPGAPVGAQDMPAHFATNGTIDPNMVASPTGPIPVSAVAGSIEAAQSAMDTYRSNLQTTPLISSSKKLSRETVERMSGADLRAVAVDRGYKDVPPVAGSRSMRRYFLQQQEEDQYLDEDEDDKKSKKDKK